jgi:hypothetical protein
MLALPLLVTTLALAPSGDRSYLGLSVGGDVGYASWSDATVPGGNGAGHSLGGEGGAGFTLYVDGIVDDDAPLSLQPFLQRASSVHVDGGGGGFRHTAPPGSSFIDQTGTSGYANLDGSVYLARWFYAYLGFGARYTAWASALRTGPTPRRWICPSTSPPACGCATCGSRSAGW